MRKGLRRSAILGAIMLSGGALYATAPLMDARAPDAAAWRHTFQRPAEIPFPEHNLYTKAKSDLGRKLFFDPSLSRAGTHSCATCHVPDRGWTDGLPKAVGAQPLAKRAPTLLNVAWIPKLGWDGHFPDLEAVAFGPLTSAKNMNMSEELVVSLLSSQPHYVEAFAAAFGPGEVTRRKIELALATFERTIVSGEAPFDRWIAGDEPAIGAAAKRGFSLFVGKAGCVACHAGWSFTDASFHDIGIASGDELGRGRLFPTSVKLRYAFKTPTLRDVARRPPYMHDGSLTGLEAVVDHYDKGGIERPSRSDLMIPLGLSEREKRDLVAFLRTLDGAPASAPLASAQH